MLLSHLAGGNQLTVLPGAIGHLHNLKELNISNNQIVCPFVTWSEICSSIDLRQTKLPSTVLNLALTQFSAHPNPFLPCPDMTRATTSKLSTTSSSSDAILTSSAKLTVNSPSGRTLSPLISSNRLAVPRLSALCLNLLISPCRPTGLPPLLDAYDWETPAKGQLHPLLDATALHQLIPNISEIDLRRLLQALKSAGAMHSQPASDLHLGGANASFLGVTQFRLDPFPRSNRDAVPDDASTNPWYYPCPSPRHLEYDVSPIGTAFKRDRHLFLHAAEERIEWREVFGIPGLPIAWSGCCPGCLAFLEEEEGANWDMDLE